MIEPTNTDTKRHWPYWFPINSTELNRTTGQRSATWSANQPNTGILTGLKTVSHTDTKEYGLPVFYQSRISSKSARKIRRLNITCVAVARTHTNNRVHCVINTWKMSMIQVFHLTLLLCRPGQIHIRSVVMWASSQWHNIYTHWKMCQATSDEEKIYNTHFQSHWKTWCEIPSPAGYVWFFFWFVWKRVSPILNFIFFCLLMCLIELQIKKDCIRR